jgi:hypothetical protein
MAPRQHKRSGQLEPSMESELTSPSTNQASRAKASLEPLAKEALMSCFSLSNEAAAIRFNKDVIVVVMHPSKFRTRHREPFPKSFIISHKDRAAHFQNNIDHKDHIQLLLS